MHASSPTTKNGKRQTSSGDDDKKLVLFCRALPRFISRSGAERLPNVLYLCTTFRPCAFARNLKTQIEKTKTLTGIAELLNQTHNLIVSRGGFVFALRRKQGGRSAGKNKKRKSATLAVERLREIRILFVSSFAFYSKIYSVGASMNGACGRKNICWHTKNRIRPSF